MNRNSASPHLRQSQEWILTPSYNGVPVEVTSLWEESLHQQSEEIQAFDEQPEVVGHDAVMEENHYGLTCHLQGAKQRKNCFICG